MFPTTECRAVCWRLALDAVQANLSCDPAAAGGWRNPEPAQPAAAYRAILVTNCQRKGLLNLVLIMLRLDIHIYHPRILGLLSGSVLKHFNG
jgi:hypothetical protein